MLNVTTQIAIGSGEDLSRIHQSRRELGIMAAGHAGNRALRTSVEQERRDLWNSVLAEVAPASGAAQSAEANAAAEYLLLHLNRIREI
jgi:hypothetical protein